MNGKTVTIWPAVLFISLLIAACAKRATPSGGPKDEKPPEIVESEPENGSTNFKGDNFVVTFNEYVAFNQLNEKFMVSPPMGNKPNIYLRGKSLHVDFLEELRDSTTYTFYFQDAIRDLNEGNPFNNFQFVFSTGNVLDSLSVTGNVFSASNLEPANNVLVLLHNNPADTAPRKQLPDYISLADKNGKFRIDNIRGGKYNIYALVDNNNNKRYDLADETFAFADSLINISPESNFFPEVIQSPDSANPEDNKIVKPDTSNVPEGMYNLYLFTAAPVARYLKSSDRKDPFHLLYVLSLPPDTLGFEFSIEGKSPESYFIEKNREGDSVNVWLSDTALIAEQQINTILGYPFTDSTGAVIFKTDTVPMRSIAVRETRAKIVKNTYKVENSLVNRTMKPGQSIRFTSPTPFRSPDTTKLRLYELEGKVRKSVPYTLLKDSMNSRRYSLNSTFREDGKYLIIADAGSFGSIYGESADSTGISFSVRPANSFGNLLLELTNVDCDLIVQVLDEKEKLIAQRFVKADGKLEFRMLEKGKYKLKAIYDMNGDGRWTTGNYDLRIQPEPVSYYGQIIEIMVNWDHSISWDVSEKNVKDQALKEVKK